MISKAKKIISINLVDSHPVEKRLGEYLRSQRDSAGEEIKDLVLAAVGSFYDPLAIASDPNSSPLEIETALIDAVLALTNQRNRLIAHCQSKYGINLSADCKSMLGLQVLQTPVSLAPTQQTISQPAPLAKQEVSSLDSLNDDDDDDDDYQCQIGSPNIQGLKLNF